MDNNPEEPEKDDFGFLLVMENISSSRSSLSTSSTTSTAVGTGEQQIDERSSRTIISSQNIEDHCDDEQKRNTSIDHCEQNLNDDDPYDLHDQQSADLKGLIVDDKKPHRITYECYNESNQKIYNISNQRVGNKNDKTSEDIITTKTDDPILSFDCLSITDNEEAKNDDDDDFIIIKSRINNNLENVSFEFNQHDEEWFTPNSIVLNNDEKSKYYHYYKQNNCFVFVDPNDINDIGNVEIIGSENDINVVNSKTTEMMMMMMQKKKMMKKKKMKMKKEKKMNKTEILSSNTRFQSRQITFEHLSQPKHQNSSLDIYSSIKSNDSQYHPINNQSLLYRYYPHSNICLNYSQFLSNPFSIMLDPPQQLQQQQQQKNHLYKKSIDITGDNIQLDSSLTSMDFFENYRKRNSSQQMLVNGSEINSFNNSMSIIMEVNNNKRNLEIRKNDPKCDTSKCLKMDNNTNVEMERGQWAGKLDFIFSCISYAVGLGNVWRFPYLCYENGGGAFLVPYLICIFIIGVPLFLMEVSLGQYFHAGGVSIWNQIPVFKGVGFASMIMIGLCNTYYIVIIAWTLYYLFSSLQFPLPWMNCQNEWNTPSCFMSMNNSSQFTPEGFVSPAQEFWKRKALNISNDMAEVGQIQWHLFVTLILAWILVYAVIYKGIHQSGKIIWVMAMFPYVILSILFGYGISLPGAINGIRFYITPKWHMLTEARIWVAAGTQLLFTYGIGIGTNIALGSYNPTNHNFYRDSLIACLLSSFTSLFSGFVIFSVLGHMAFTMNANVSDVARSGPGLAFIVYPEAVTRLPLPNLWAILFFIMLLVLGIDSQFCTVESFITGIVDEWPRFLRPHRKMFTLLVVVINFLIGISMITSGGMYVFQLMDNFSASGITLIVVVLFELSAFAWIFGGKRIYEQMVEMLTFKPTSLLYYLWCYISPACLLAILIFSIVDYRPPEYAGRPFPWYGEIFGWCIASASIIFIPIYMLYYVLFKTDPKLSFKERFLIGFKPSSDVRCSATKI